MGDEGGAACSLGVDPQGRLLGHRAGRQEQRRRLAEHVGDFRLELRDNSALSVLVLFVIGTHLAEHLCGGLHTVAHDEAGALPLKGPLLVGQRPEASWNA